MRNEVRRKACLETDYLPRLGHRELAASSRRPHCKRKIIPVYPDPCDHDYASGGLCLHRPPNLDKSDGTTRHAVSTGWSRPTASATGASKRDPRFVAEEPAKGWRHIAAVVYQSTRTSVTLSEIIPALSPVSRLLIYRTL